MKTTLKTDVIRVTDLVLPFRQIGSGCFDLRSQTPGYENLSFSGQETQPRRGPISITAVSTTCGYNLASKRQNFHNRKSSTCGYNIASKRPYFHNRQVIDLRMK